MRNTLRKALIATTIALTSSSLISVNVLANEVSIEFNKNNIQFKNYDKDKIYNNSFTLKPVSKKGEIVVIDKIIVNNKPQKNHVIDQSGENLVEVVVRDVITNKKYKDILQININKTPISKYDTSLTSIRLNEVRNVETSKFFKDVENDEIFVETYEDEFVKVEQKGNSLYFKGKKETNEHFITLKSSDYNGKGDIIENVEINVFTTQPEIDFKELKFDSEFSDITELVGSKEPHYLVDGKLDLTFNFNVHDGDGGKGRYEIFDNNKIIAEGTIDEISKNNEGTPLSITVPYANLDTNTINHVFKIIVFDDTNKKGTHIKIPSLTIIPEKTGEHIIKLSEMYKNDYEELNRIFTSYELENIYDLNKTLNNIKKGNAFLNSFTLFRIESLYEGELKKLFLNDFFVNIEHWLLKTNNSLYQEDYELSNLHYINHLHGFEVNIALDKLKKDVEDVTIDNVKDIILIERNFNLLEKGYDINVITDTILKINNLPNGELKTSYLEMIKDVQSDYTLGSNLHLTSSDFKYFSEVYELGEKSFKDDKYLNDYIMVLASSIAKNNLKEESEQEPLYTLLIDSISQTSELINLIELTAQSNKDDKLTKEQITDIKEYIKNNELEDIMEYRDIIKEFEGGKEITSETLTKYKNVYYIKNHHNLYLDQIKKLDKKLTYKEYLNFLNLLNIYENARKNPDVKVGASQDLMKYFNFNNKYALINNLNKSSLQQLNTDKKYRENKNYRDYGIMSYLEDYKNTYNIMANQLVENKVDLDVENLHYMTLFINEALPLMENNVIYIEKPFEKKVMEEIFDNYFKEYKGKDKDTIKEVIINKFEDMYNRKELKNKKKLEYKKINSYRNLCRKEFEEI